jgi:DNA-binding response OmpR family regulator
MPKILIIEDEFDILRVLQKRLSDAGFEIITSVDAYQGVQKAHKERPDLIILDLMIPAGGGLSVLRNIKASDHTKLTPVLVLTGMENEKYRQDIIDEGVQGYLQKPYNVQELLNEIKRILEN